MAVLGIENRTENWKTAVHFSPLFSGDSSQLAIRLGAEPSPRPPPQFADGEPTFPETGWSGACGEERFYGSTSKAKWKE